MKRIYKTPELEIETFEVSDVITASVIAYRTTTGNSNNVPTVSLKDVTWTQE